MKSVEGDLETPTIVLIIGTRILKKDLGKKTNITIFIVILRFNCII